MFDQDPPGPAGPGSRSTRRLGTPIGLGLIAFVLAVGVVAIGQALGAGDGSEASTTTSPVPGTDPTGTTGPAPTDTDPSTTGGTDAPGTSLPGSTTRRSGGAHCTFTRGVTESCESSDPAVDLRVIFNSDARQCSFENVVDWGDGTGPERSTVSGGQSGARRVASHTYRRTGRFAIHQQLRLTAGSCRAYEGAYSFSLTD